MQIKHCFLHFFVSLIALFVLITNSAAQELPQVAPQSPRFDNPKHEYHDTLPTVGIDKRKRQTNDRFQGYGKQKLLFKSLCAAIAEDGRNEWLYEHTKDYVRTTIGCVACKQFFKAISAPCRPRPVRLPKIKKVAEREPSANNDPESPQPEETPQEYQPPKKRTEPNILVLDLTSRLFREIAADDRLSIETYEAIKKLLVILREKEGKTRGEQSYFEILAEFIFAPYREYQRMLDYEARLAEAQERANNTDRFDVDEIFGK